MIRLRRLLKMNSQELYDAQQGQDWDLAMWLAQSRNFMKGMPAWKFWPLALMKWSGFRRMQADDHVTR